MNTFITVPNLTFALGLLGVIFAVYKYFRGPQEDLEKKQAVDQMAIDSKADILSEQVKWGKELNEKRFTEFGVRLDTALTLAQNHIHTVDTKVDNLLVTIGKMSNEITRLSTIIEERIPKK